MRFFVTCASCAGKDISYSTLLPLLESGKLAKCTFELQQLNSIMVVVLHWSWSSMQARTVIDRNCPTSNICGLKYQIRSILHPPARTARHRCSPWSTSGNLTARGDAGELVALRSENGAGRSQCERRLLRISFFAHQLISGQASRLSPCRQYFNVSDPIYFEI